MVTLAMLPLTVPPPDEVTVIVALDEVGPLNACALAVTVADPAPTAVAKPLEFTVTTAVLLDAQVTPLETTFVLVWLAFP